MSANSAIRVHTTFDGAMATAGVGNKVVSKKWNKTSVQNAMERHIVLPMECITATVSEVSETFKPLVDSALYSAAVMSLVAEIKEKGENCFELDSAAFTRPRLIEVFLGGDTWLDKENVEKLFTVSATWKRMVGRPEYGQNKVYKDKVQKYKENILKLSAKSVAFTVDNCDKMLAAWDDADMDTELGAFVVKRLAALRNKAETESADYEGL